MNVGQHTACSIVADDCIGSQPYAVESVQTFNVTDDNVW